MTRTVRGVLWVAGLALLTGCARPEETYFRCGSATVAVRARLLRGAQAAARTPRLPDGVRAMFGPDTPGPQIIIEARIVETSHHAIRRVGLWWGQEGVQYPTTVRDKTAKMPAVNVGIGMGLDLGGRHGGGGESNWEGTHEGEGRSVGVTPGIGMGMPVLGGRQGVGTRDVEALFQVPGTGVTLDTTMVFLDVVERQSSTMVLSQPMLLTLSSEPAKIQDDDQAPAVNARPVTTNVQLSDGQTVILGGLVREDLENVEDNVPLLDKIPVLGHLFKSKGDGTMKRTLLIMVTPRIIIQEEE